MSRTGDVSIRPGATRRVPVCSHGGRAFTLVELLVVVGIIAVLISLLMPALSKARYQAQVTVCAARLQQLAQACNTYAAQNRGQLPRFDVPGGPPNLWDISVDLYAELTGPYKLPHAMFFCPLSRDDLVDTFWKEPEASGFYRAGYSLWIPRKSGASGVIPPSPNDGQGLFTMQTEPFRGPTRLGDEYANRNPIFTDVLLSTGTGRVLPCEDASSLPMAEVYPYSQHQWRGRLESINAAFADGHVVRLHPAEVKPRFISWNSYWNWW